MPEHVPDIGSVDFTEALDAIDRILQADAVFVRKLWERASSEQRAQIGALLRGRSLPYRIYLLGTIAGGVAVSALLAAPTPNLPEYEPSGSAITGPSPMDIIYLAHPDKERP